MKRLTILTVLLGLTPFLTAAPDASDYYGGRYLPGYASQLMRQGVRSLESVYAERRWREAGYGGGSQTPLRQNYNAPYVDGYSADAHQAILSMGEHLVNLTAKLATEVFGGSQLEAEFFCDWPGADMSLRNPRHITARFAVHDPDRNTDLVRVIFEGPGIDGQIGGLLPHGEGCFQALLTTQPLRLNDVKFESPWFGVLKGQKQIVIISAHFTEKIVQICRSTSVKVQ